MAGIKIENGRLIYRKMLKTCELLLEDLVWAYLQREEVNAVLCCGRMGMEIGRVVVQDKDGKKEFFQFESMEEARELLARLQKANPNLAVGYTEENRRRFEGA